jgi:hypothetical protein
MSKVTIESLRMLFAAVPMLTNELLALQFGGLWLAEAWFGSRKVASPIRADIHTAAANRPLLDLGLVLESSLQLVFIVLAPSFWLNCVSRSLVFCRDRRPFLISIWLKLASWTS